MAFKAYIHESKPPDEKKRRIRYRRLGQRFPGRQYLEASKPAAVSQIDPAPHAVQRSDSLAKGWHHIIALRGRPHHLFGAPLRD